MIMAMILSLSSFSTVACSSIAYLPVCSRFGSGRAVAICSQDQYGFHCPVAYHNTNYQCKRIRTLSYCCAKVDLSSDSETQSDFSSVSRDFDSTSSEELKTEENEDSQIYSDSRSIEPRRRKHEERRHREEYGRHVPRCENVELMCDFRAEWCINPEEFDRMVLKCPKTCNRCPDEIIDLHQMCKYHSRDCFDPQFMDFLAWQCPFSCGYTVENRPRPNGKSVARMSLGGATTRTCGPDLPECLAWSQNGFCANEYYTAENKAEHCPNTCGLCQL